MGRRVALTSCLIFSGLAALVYQVIWTRLLGFAFGTTTEAIGSVLAVFFGGLALGNWLAARRLVQVERPLRVYAWLEAGIGLWALATLPLLQRLDELFAWLPDAQGLAAAALRLAAAALLLLPPTVAMGATLPVVARGLVGDDRSLGRWSAILYTSNTLGAVLGAYLCGFWLVPFLGLTASVWTAGGVNLAVAGLVLALGGSLRAAAASQEAPGEPAPARPAPGRAVFLFLFGVSGFVAIGYEIVWSKLLGIVMEGTLYGFAAVLSAYLLGIALGSLAIAPFVDRIRDLPRAFGLLHAAIALAVAAGVAAVPYLPYALHRLTSGREGGDAVHLLFLIAAPIVLVPTACFGAAFPVLIRIYTRSARQVGEGMGVATAVNTAGSILASFAIGFLAIPALGMDATLYALLLLDAAAACFVLLRLQESAGAARLRGLAFGAAALALVVLGFGGAHAPDAIVGKTAGKDSLAAYRQALASAGRSIEFLAEGRNSIVTVHETGRGYALRNNGMPEAGLTFEPPYLSLEETLLGLLPYLMVPEPERALVVGLGGANTVEALRATRLREIDVVELEPQVVSALDVIFHGRESPLADPRVRLFTEDGRHLLLRGRARSARYDLIASQPSHPWLTGAANLFTEEYFALARDNLSEGGLFALWFNGFRTDAESVLAIVTSFERVFPGALLVDADARVAHQSLVLLGARQPLRPDLARMRSRLAEPAVNELLARFEVASLEALLARAIAPAAAFAALEPALRNDDDGAFVEARIPRRLLPKQLDFTQIERRLAADAPVLPPLAGTLDPAGVAEALLARRAGPEDWPLAGRLTRLVRVHGGELDPLRAESLVLAAALRGAATRAEAEARLRALAAQHPGRAEPLRALARQLARREKRYAEAADLFGEAFRRSGEAADAFDAARAMHHVDPQRAATLAARVPRRERERFPRLAVFEAERALAEGGAALRPAQAALLAYRDTPEGRERSEVNALLARLAQALGDDEDARYFADLDHVARAAAAESWLRRASQALAAGRLDQAERALAAVAEQLPASSRASSLRAELAHRRSDARALEEAFAAIRAGAPSVPAGIGAENRLRARLGLPLRAMHERASETAAVAPGAGH
jgi:spermidine synthase